MSMFKRILSLVLALVLLVGTLPPTALAAETEETIPETTAAETTLSETTAAETTEGTTAPTETAPEMEAPAETTVEITQSTEYTEETAVAETEAVETVPEIVGLESVEADQSASAVGDGWGNWESDYVDESTVVSYETGEGL